MIDIQRSCYRYFETDSAGLRNNEKPFITAEQLVAAYEQNDSGKSTKLHKIKYTWCVPSNKRHSTTPMIISSLFNIGKQQGCNDQVRYTVLAVYHLLEGTL